MKNVFLLASLLVSVFTLNAQDTLVAYLSPDGMMTHILNKARGGTVMSLSNDTDYVLTLTTPQDGWWKIVDIWTACDDDSEVVLEGSDTGEYWIHFRALGLGTSNYGGQELYLRDAPDDNANIVFTFNQEMELMPMGIQGDWVKVMVDGYVIVGWIEAEWLCSNPLTNCC